MEILSSSNNTQILGFPDLETKYMHTHTLEETQDFQFVPDKRLFLTINKTSGFELLRSVVQNGAPFITRMKKRKIDDLVCGATSSFSKNDIALGLSTGYIKFFNIKTAEFLATKFKPGTYFSYLSYSILIMTLF